MPDYKVPARNPSETQCTTTSQRISSQSALTSSKMSGQQLTSQMSGKEKDGLFLSSQNRTEEINSTYVISACNNANDASVTLKPQDRLTLQRRTRVSKKMVSSSEQLDNKIRQSIENTQTGKRCTLQRRVRTGSVEKSKINWNAVPGIENNDFAAERNYKTVLRPNINNNDTRHGNRSCKLAEGQSNTKMHFNLNSKDLFGNVENDKRTPVKRKTSTADSKLQNEAHISEQLVTSKNINRISGEQLNEKGDVNKLEEKQRLQHLMIKHNSLERPTISTKGSTEGFKLTPKNSTFQDQSSLSALNKRPLHPPLVSKKKTGVSSCPPVSRSAKAKEKVETLTENNSTEEDIFKVENSKVTVAVRVRPFSNREKNENSLPVVSMSGSETAVRNPSTNQVYTFSYDFSFWSFDKCHPNFASQAMIYKTLALPLLERAFEGYNACLFAYGQTGTGKSYTMMGFDEDRGIIPRLCEDLFSQMDKQQVLYHLEMSYFEVYNEKIHDLLVFKAENRQKKQPLRVREHPVLGPYVEDLTVNVVSSYSDIQSWLELGNKQRATAATVMNDKSSRSHSVFTLVMTQTKVESVDEEQRDRSLTSHINLIDLAGSECCSTAQTTGERLKEGVSINKSLLTLGKVISALSKQSQNGKKTFIPYRESVLTWLLKESLGGNSQTAMIATISPAASSTEETLSTLRYAKQACSIINIAKVNEDVNAKLIRELKAEIEKLKAQKSAQSTDPEKYRRYLQEITSLRMKLHQQERDTAEMQRAWKEKLEQAEKRKLEDIKELQKAGIAFKMDNRLPNLVNLSEDPQLSEVLLYMIKEGETTVGRYTPNSKHDIQLSGVLIADDHCVIKNNLGQVSIIPRREAKTYVNGKCILDPTVLHHGDRVILGGDHYFRFNHPVEVQKVKRPSCGTTLLHDGPKDFEFAKNELLIAQKTQLESEIEEARLKAKEEMMQSVQIAKEMIQQELTSQKEAYESKIKSLEAEVREESRKKQMQELKNQKAATKIQELEKAKQNLELELHFNKKRLEVETLATKQALEDHSIHHAKILQALEAEKQKIAEEIQTLQKNRGSGNKTMTIPLNWNSLKLSVMIKEANTISNELGKNTVFCRHDKVDDKTGTVSSIQVQVRNIKLGIATFWSLEKFECKLAAMKELYESNDNNKAADVFYDPADEWEPDLSDASVSSLSRRRSRSLMKNKRISRCLSGIKLEPTHDTQTSYISGSQSKSSICPNFSESLLPGICKESVSSALDLLEQNHEGRKSIADHLLRNLFTIFSGVSAISKAYEQQDEECQKNFFSTDHAAQSYSIKITSVFGQLVVLVKVWLNHVQKCPGSVKTDEELKQEVKNLGGYLQLLLQGCSSDISSMVTEAQSKVNEAVKQTIKCIGHLAVFTRTDISIFEESDIPATSLQDFVLAVYDGVGLGLDFLTETVQEEARMVQEELLKQHPQNEIQNRIRDDAVALARFLENNISSCRKKEVESQLPEEDYVYMEIKRSTKIAVKYLELEQCLAEVYQIVSSTLQGSFRNTSPLRSFAGEICFIAGCLYNYFNSLPLASTSTNNPIQRTPMPFMNLDELDSLVDSLIVNFELDQGQQNLKSQPLCNETTETEGRQSETGGDEFALKLKGIPKHTYKLQSPPTFPEELSLGKIQWV